jgi:hypothetical protein
VSVGLLVAVLSMMGSSMVAAAAVEAHTVAKQAPETPKQFLDRLAAALRKGDSKFLLQRLNPAVIDRYGLPLCRGFVLTLKDATAKITVQRVGPPGPFDYTSDGETTTVAKTRSVTAKRTSDGSTSTQVIHVAPTPNGQKLTWFTSCRPTGADAVARALAPYTGTYTGKWQDTHFNLGGDMKVVVAIDTVAHTLSLELTFTGPLFGATQPSTEQLAPVSIDIAQFGAPVTGTSKIFGPYTVTYDATGKVTVKMPQCSPGSCTLTGTLKPGTFSGNVSVDLTNGTKSQGTVELKKQ